MSFPWGKSSNFAIFTAVNRRDDKPLPITLEALRDVMDANMMREAVPPLTTMQEESGGWWWLDAVDVISVDRWVVFGWRRWTRKVSSTLLNAIVEEEIRKRRKLWDHYTPGVGDPPPKTTAKAIKEFRDQQAKDLMYTAQPTIEVIPIAVDVLTRTVIMCTGSSRTVDDLRPVLAEMLSDVHGCTTALNQWRLSSQLWAARPGAALPAELQRNAMAWLCRLASDFTKVRMPCAWKSSGFTVAIELADAVTAAVDGDDGVVSIHGEQAVLEAVDRWLEEDDDAIAIQDVKVRLKAQGREYIVRIDNTGAVRSVRVENADSYSKKDGDWDAASLDRCADFLLASELVRGLWSYFDQTELTRVMNEAPQLQFWPGGGGDARERTVHLVESDSDEDAPKLTPLERAIAETTAGEWGPTVEGIMEVVARLDEAAGGVGQGRFDMPELVDALELHPGLLRRELYRLVHAGVIAHTEDDRFARVVPEAAT